jgi:hypothetical protein
MPESQSGHLRVERFLETGRLAPTLAGARGDAAAAVPRDAGRFAGERCGFLATARFSGVLTRQLGEGQ